MAQTELPKVVVAETQRVVFDVSPLSSQGDLSEQARRAVQALFRQAGSARIVKLRAFVAGTPETEGLEVAVKELFAKRRMPLPALSVVVIGALPERGARIVLESVAVANKPVNPHGVAFVSGQPASTEKPVAQVAPLIEKALAALQTAHRGAGLEARDILRVTCFVTSLEDISAVRRLVKAEFPQAAANYPQLQRSPARGVVECETVGRLRSPVNEPLKLVQPEGLTKSPNYSHVAMVGASKVALTSAQFAPGPQDSDARAAFEALGKVLQEAGASIRNVAMSSVYPGSAAASDLARKIRFEFYDRARPPASTMLLFEGVPAPGASFGVDVVAPIAQ